MGLLPARLSSFYFNPRPREGGRPVLTPQAERGMFISIHAPARGGDAEVRGPCGLPNISIHAPARGGDASLPDGVCAPSEFQSTPPRGGATLLLALICFDILISIHAPARGGDSKDAQFYLRIFDKQVELLRFWGKMRGGCLRNPEKDRRFLGKSLANLPEISGHLDFAGA